MTAKYLARLIRESYSEYDYRDDPDDIDEGNGCDHDHGILTILNYANRNKGQASTPAGLEDAIAKSETIKDFDHAMAMLHKECIARLNA
jgi:hypothetical protein